MNSRTLNEGIVKEGRLAQLVEGCQAYDIDVVAIQEHRQIITKELEYTNTDGGGTFVKSSANARGVGGIGIYFNKVTKGRLQ